MGTVMSCVNEIIRERREYASDSQLRYVAGLLEKAGFSDWDEVLMAFAGHLHPDETLPLRLEDLTKRQSCFRISREMETCRVLTRSMKVDMKCMACLKAMVPATVPLGRSGGECRRSRRGFLLQLVFAEGVAWSGEAASGVHSEVLGRGVG